MQTNNQSDKSKKRPGRFPSSAKVGRSNNFIFIICLLIATLFWFLIKLSGDYTLTYPFKIEYTGVPVDKKLTAVSDSNVNITFSTNGFILLKLNLLNNLKTLRINLAELDLVKEKDNYYQVNTNEIKKILAQEIGVNSSDILISKPFLGMEMDVLYSRKVKVSDRFTLNFNEQYYLYKKEIITPAEVTLFGPDYIIDTLKHIFTEPITIDQIGTEQILQAKLVNPLPNILTLEPKEVSVMFFIEKFTESSLIVPVDISGINESIKIFPKDVKISFKIAQKDFNTINVNQIRIVPDLTNIDINQATKLKLLIAEKPEFIRDEWLSPADVEFLIVK